MTTALVLSAASLALCGFSFIYLRAYVRKRTAALGILADFQEEVEKLKAEINFITDRDAALVEDRIKTLRALLAGFDRRIALAGRETELHRRQEAAYAALGRRKPGGPPPAAGKKRREEPSPPPAENAPAPEAAGETAPQGELPLFVRAPEELPPAPLPFAEEVERLSQAGLSPELIAARLGSTLAEVGLALALARRR